jgi:transcriptional regulator of acetoin/glycerol metabolism
MLKQLTATPTEVAPEALESLRSYSWPGNVRQLRNCLERAVLLSNDGRITPGELPPEVARTNGSTPFVAPQIAGEPAMTVSGDNASNTGSLRDIEKQQIIAALERTGWHRGKAAEALGISPSTLYRRLRDYNLEGRLR